MDQHADDERGATAQTQAAMLGRQVDEDAQELDAMLREQGVVIEDEYLPGYLNSKQVQAVRRTFDRYLEHRATLCRAARPRLSEAEVVRRCCARLGEARYADGRFWQYQAGSGWAPLPAGRVIAEVRDALEQAEPAGLGRAEQRTRSVLERLRHHLAAPAGKWDTAPSGLLPLRNGLLDPLTGGLRPYEAGDLIATTLPYDYEPGATAPAWQSFLETTVPEAVDFLQEFAGYCLTDDTKHEVAVWLCGPSGCGKSTCVHALEVLLGPRAGALRLEDLAPQRLQAGTVEGKMLLLSDEPPRDETSAALYASGLLQAARLVSGEALWCRNRGAGRDLAPARAKWIWALDQLPRLDERLAGLYRRVCVVAFPELSPERRDPTLKQRLAQEGPGIFNWAMAGLQRLTGRGRFDPPEAVLSATRQLRELNSTPADFVAERCEASAGARCQALTLYRAYVDWCEARGIAPCTPRALAAEWQRLGFERSRVDGRSYWYGVKLLR